MKTQKALGSVWPLVLMVSTLVGAMGCTGPHAPGDGPVVVPVSRRDVTLRGGEKRKELAITLREFPSNAWSNPPVLRITMVTIEGVWSVTSASFLRDSSPVSCEVVASGTQYFDIVPSGASSEDTFQVGLLALHDDDEPEVVVRLFSPIHGVNRTLRTIIIRGMSVLAE